MVTGLAARILHQIFNLTGRDFTEKTNTGNSPSLTNDAREPLASPARNVYGVEQAFSWLEWDSRTSRLTKSGPEISSRIP